MMGIPRSHHGFLLDRTNRILGGLDPEFLPEDGPNPVHLLTAGAELAELVRDLAQHRRAYPTGDLTCALVTANVDGESLSDQEIASFFILLVAAGNETTRNAIHGLVLLDENPDQRALWASDFERHAGTAVEEILRVSSPLAYTRRTVTGEVSLGGHRFRAGDKVLLFYWSANRDEAVFA
jgi:methyl-branched lipid omega-hydroxylase